MILSFQLTPSRRATLSWRRCFRRMRYFNSRPHGGRPVHAAGIVTFWKFQLTPSRRATVCVSPNDAAQESFQLTPSRRATVNPTGTIFGWCIFQLTPSRRATCKFRQIFLLNRGYAYSISLYFLPHFISLLPQILSFQQKPFKFQVRIFLLFSVHLAFALQNQCVHHVKSRFCTNMFYFVFVLFTQIVKSQTISLFIYDFF